MPDTVLKKHIRVIAPSSYIDQNAIDTAVQWLEDHDFQVSLAPQITMRHFYTAGSVNDRLTALHDAFTDPDVDIVMTACGGNGTIHLLDKIDFDLIRSHPKPIIGFSDITILLNAIYAKTGVTTYHGPTLSQISKPLPDDQLQQMISIFKGQKNPIKWDNVDILHRDKTTVSGRLIGGNLSVFQTLIGTDYMPDLSVPYILFFEDVGDEISRYDRMLAHLRIAGIMGNAETILFGDFHSTDNPARVKFGKTMAEVVADNTSDLKCPVIMNCPLGHRGNLWTLPLGQQCTVTFGDDNIVIR